MNSRTVSAPARLSGVARPRNRRRVRGPLSRDAVVASVLLTLAWAVVMWAVRDHWPPDMSALWFGPHFYWTGDQAAVYSSSPTFFGDGEIPGWSALRDAMGYPGEIIYPYIYPPLWAALLAPVTALMDPPAFFRAAYAVQLAELAGSIVLAWRIMGRPMTLTRWVLLSLALLGSSTVGYMALAHDQPQITVAFLVLLAFERVSVGREAQAGLLLGTVAAIKLTPILLLLVLLAMGYRRAALVTLLTAAALAVASVAVAGQDMNLLYLQKLHLVSGQVLFTEANFSGASVLYALQRTLVGAPLDTSLRVALAPMPLWLELAMPALMLVGLAAVLRATRHQPETARLPALLPAAMIVITACSPLAWAHHYLAPLLLLPVVACEGSPFRGGLRMAAVGLALSAPVFILLQSSGDLLRIVPVTYSVLLMMVLAVMFTQVGSSRS